MATVVYIDTRQEVPAVKPKQPRRRKYNRIDIDNPPSDAELQKMLREMYGDSLPAFLTMTGDEL